MSTPIITATIEDWAEWAVGSAREIATFRGEEFTAERAERIRQGVLTPRRYRYSPADDYDFTRDDGDQDVSGGLADRASDREHKWMQGERP